ncbi:MAG: PAS domain S-box protein, partial [Myxococcales bacterium]|nr:PAS domain S-box protein [Myxococcales bacterium]
MHGALLYVTRPDAVFATLEHGLRELGVAPRRRSLDQARAELGPASAAIVVLDRSLVGAREYTRELLGYPQVATIVLIEEPAELGGAMREGADDVLCGPWSARALRERVEAARVRLQRSSGAARSLVDAWATHTDDALVVLDERGHIVLWNTAAVAVLGYEQREVLGRPLAELVDVFAELGETPTEQVEELLSGDARASTSMRLRGLDGEVQEFALAVTQWRESGQRRVGLRVEETATQELEEEMMRLASFPELDPNPVLEFSRTGTLSYMNPAMAALPKDAANALIEGVRSVIARFDADEGVNLVREIEERGTWYEQHIHYAPAWDSVRVYAQDISERKAAERELIKARDTLELRVHERTVDLQREIEERKNAELRAIEASQAKSVFLATMSHE